ncbi:MAG TPA: STN domain-containing protein, partial [Rhizomicrobium sp.]|nr:STN domain-containing protein [Rhizomicrobium sp.]
MTRSILKTTAATALVLSIAQAARAEDFNIPGGDLARALNAYTAQTGQSLVVSGEAVRGVRTRGVKGNLSQDDALSHILAGTGFTIQRDSGVIAIVRGERQS